MTLREPPRLPPTAGHAPRQQASRSVTIDTGFTWPVLVSLTVPLGLLVSLLLLGLRAGKSFKDALSLAIFVACITLIVLIVVLPIGVLVLFQILEFKRAQPERTRPRSRKERVPYPVPTTKRGTQRETRQDKWNRAFAKGPLPRIGQALRKTGDHLVSAPPPKRLQNKYAHDISPVQAWVEDPGISQMEKLYHITRYFYGKKVTRDDFKPFGEGWQSLYAEYKLWVSDSGFGWVSLDGRQTIVDWRIPEHECYESDRTLKQIAVRNGFKFPERSAQ